MNGQAGRAWGLAAALCVAVLALDQATKAIAKAHLISGQYVHVVGPLEFVLTWNNGVAFGLASGGGALLLLFTGLALAVVVYIFYRHPSRPGMWLAVGFLTGGALGNLIDRIHAGTVTDYIAIGDWPAFNVADIAVTVGVVLLAASFLREPPR